METSSSANNRLHVEDERWCSGGREPGIDVQLALLQFIYSFVWQNAMRARTK